MNTTRNPNRALSFDGKGINGADEYRSRIATLTEYGHASGCARILAAGPDLLRVLDGLMKCATMTGPHGIIVLCTGQERIDEARALVSDLRSPTETTY